MMFSASTSEGMRAELKMRTSSKGGVHVSLSAASPYHVHAPINPVKFAVCTQPMVTGCWRISTSPESAAEKQSVVKYRIQGGPGEYNNTQCFRAPAPHNYIDQSQKPLGSLGPTFKPIFIESLCRGANFDVFTS